MMSRYRTYGRYGYTAHAGRFPNYREITARFDSNGGCGHPISKGDRIGYQPKIRKTQCASCWARWVAENNEAGAIERGYAPCPW